MESPRLPLEIICQIIDYSRDDEEVLKAFALTASALVFPAQSYLFRRIDLDPPKFKFMECCSGEAVKLYEAFDRILRHSPVVGSYVCELIIGDLFRVPYAQALCVVHFTKSFETLFTKHATLISSILSFLPNVSHFVLTPRARAKPWMGHVPPPTQEAITKFLRSSSRLSSLSLYSVTFMSKSLLPSILQQSHITTLKLEESLLHERVYATEVENSLKSSSLTNLHTLVLIAESSLRYHAIHYITSLILKAASESLRHFTWFTTHWNLPSPFYAGNTMDPPDLTILTNLQTLTLTWMEFHFAALIRAPLQQIVNSRRSTVTVMELVHHGETRLETGHFNEFEDILQDFAFSALSEIRFVFLEKPQPFISSFGPTQAERDHDDLSQDFPRLTARGVVIKVITSPQWALEIFKD